MKELEKQILEDIEDLIYIRRKGDGRYEEFKSRLKQTIYNYLEIMGDEEPNEDIVKGIKFQEAIESSTDYY